MGFDVPPPKPRYKGIDHRMVFFDDEMSESWDDDDDEIQDLKDLIYKRQKQKKAKRFKSCH